MKRIEQEGKESRSDRRYPTWLAFNVEENLYCHADGCLGYLKQKTTSELLELGKTFKQEMKDPLEA